MPSGPEAGDESCNSSCVCTPAQLLCALRATAVCCHPPRHPGTILRQIIYLPGFKPGSFTGEALPLSSCRPFPAPRVAELPNRRERMSQEEPSQHRHVRFSVTQISPPVQVGCCERRGSSSLAPVGSPLVVVKGFASSLGLLKGTF